jgi:hypothetical protein
MRFSADYDSEEEEFPVEDAQSSEGLNTTPDIWDSSSGTDEDSDDSYADVFLHLSPRPNHDAWVRALELAVSERLANSLLACNKQQEQRNQQTEHPECKIRYQVIRDVGRP